MRPVYFDEAGGFTATPVFWRDDLPVGTALAGPAVVEQYDSTTLLHPGWHLVVDRTENLVLRSVITAALLRQPPKQDDATVARSTDI